MVLNILYLKSTNVFLAECTCIDASKNKSSNSVLLLQVQFSPVHSNRVSLIQRLAVKMVTV